MNKKALYESIMKNVAIEVKKALNESAEDGWDLESSELTDILSEIYDLQYEVKNCIRGSFTNCMTYKLLGQYIIELADQLKYAGETIEGMYEPEETEEDIDEGDVF